MTPTPPLPKRTTKARSDTIFVCPRCGKDSLYAESHSGFVPAVMISCYACFWRMGEVRLPMLVNDLKAEILRLLVLDGSQNIGVEEPDQPDKKQTAPNPADPFSAFVRVPGLPGLSVLVADEGLSQEQTTELAGRVLALPRADRPMLPREWRAFYRENKATLLKVQP